MSYIKAGYTPPQPQKPPKRKKEKPEKAQRKKTTAYEDGMDGMDFPDIAPQAATRTKKKRSFGVRVLRVLAGLLAAVTMAAIAFVLFAYGELNRYDGQFYPGVYVGGVHLGGLTFDQAMTALQSSVTEEISDYQLTLSYEDIVVKTITAQEISLHFDLQGQLEKAWQTGRSGNMIQRLFTVRALRDAPQIYPATVAYDTAAVEGIINTLAQEVYIAPRDAASAFAPDSNTPFLFEDEEYGAQLDTEDLRAQIESRVKSLSTDRATLKVDAIAPNLSRADLENGLTLLVQTTSTIATTSEEGRNANVILATEKINGVVLQPGQRFSFNSVVGKRTKGNGYTEALELAYGEYVTGIGGGVCQVSTALYQAALRANLSIIERHPHAIPSSYAERGQDATVSDQGLDLVFRNSTNAPIYIKSRAIKDGNKLRRIEISIFGMAQEARYTLESVVTQVIAIPEPVRVKDNEQKYVLYTDEEKQTSNGREGYVVDTYLVTKKNDVVVEKTLLTTDTYQAAAPRIYVGTLERFVPTENMTD